MFRIEVFVEDRKLAYVLWALSGHVVNMTAPQPVVNAEKKNGKIAAETSGNSVDMLRKWLVEHKFKTVRAAQIRTFCEEVGLSSKSYYNMVTRARNAGLLKKTRKAVGARGSFEYEVLK